MLLFYCIPMRDTNELAHKMIKEFGSLVGLFEANPKDICKRCGVSENTAILVSLIPSLARRYFKGKWGEFFFNNCQRLVSTFLAGTHEAL